MGNMAPRGRQRKKTRTGRAKHSSAEPGVVVGSGTARGYLPSALSSSPVHVETLENGLTELVNAITAASLAIRIAVEPDTLDGDAPVTVFAPDDAAFQGASLQGEDLDAVLATHAVAGQLLASDLTPGRILTTVGGNQLTVGNGGGGVPTLTDERGNTFRVLTTDIRTLNGAVHVIDGVLLPAP